MESLYRIKYQLKSNYEEFFFTTREISDKYAYHTVDEKITVINEKKLFNKETYEDEVTNIININELKKFIFFLYQ